LPRCQTENRPGPVEGRIERQAPKKTKKKWYSRKSKPEGEEVKKVKSKNGNRETVSGTVAKTAWGGPEKQGKLAK